MQLRRLARAFFATASTVVLAASCSSNEVPESLPMLEDAPASAVAADEANSTASETPDEVVLPGTDEAVAELTPEQQTALDACAASLNAAASAADPESPTYADDVVSILLDPASSAAVDCGPLLETDSGIDQGLMISFMLENLPPELLSTLGALMPDSGNATASDAADEATLEPAAEDSVID